MKTNGNPNTAAVLAWRQNPQGKVCNCGSPAEGKASQGYFICARCRALESAYQGKKHRGVNAGVREPVRQAYEPKETRFQVEIIPQPDGWLIRAHGAYRLLQNLAQSSPQLNA